MKVGLALGSGASRGWAHIGIIEALTDLGIEIDVVAGCSIGAYVGSAYASGKLAELKDWAFSLNEWQVISLMGIGLRRGGLATGSKVFEKHKEEFCANSYEEMVKPFACVATDLYTGREVRFTEGEIGDSIQASCAIPALFSPVPYGDRWLVDGAVVNPVPVNLCRQLGADFVIAVNLNKDSRPQMLAKRAAEKDTQNDDTDHFFKKGQDLVKQLFVSEEKTQSQPPGIISVMSHSLEILQARVARSRLAGDPPDLLLEANLSEVSLMDFHKAEEIYTTGKETVERSAKQIEYQLLNNVQK